MFCVVFGCKNLGFKNLACVKEMTNMRYERGVRCFQLPDWSQCSILGPSDDDDVDVEHGWMPEKGASHAKGGSHPKHSEEKKGEDAHLDSKFVSSILASGFSISVREDAHLDFFTESSSRR